MNTLSWYYYTSDIMRKKKITLEDLALMVARGFDEVNSKIAELATKVELQKVEERLTKRIDHIENLLLTDHRNRIERLEDRIRVLEAGRKN